MGFGCPLLESEFTSQEEETFLSHYESDQTPVSHEKIAIYKILQDTIWSLWTVYKEEQGEDFGDYGVNRYQRAIKGLASYGVQMKSKNRFLLAFSQVFSGAWV